MKLFISFQVVIMSSGVTASRSSFGWMFTPRWLVGNLHDLSPGLAWFTRCAGVRVCVYPCVTHWQAKQGKRGEQRHWRKETEGSSGGGCWGVRLGSDVTMYHHSGRCELQILIARAMKMIWSGLSGRETATGPVMKICWDGVLCLRIHQTCPLRWKASVIHHSL